MQPREEHGVVELALDNLRGELKTGLDGIRGLTTQIHGILTAYMAGQSQQFRGSIQAAADLTHPYLQMNQENPMTTDAGIATDHNLTDAVTLLNAHLAPASTVAPPKKFLSILKNFGANFGLGIKAAVALEAKALPVEQDVAQDIAIFNPALGTTLQQLLGVVGNVEMIATAVGASNGTGKQKLEAAIPGVEAAILADPIFKGKQIADLQKYNTAIATITGSLADLGDSIASTTPAPPPA